MRVALLALNACAGDAIGNQLAGKVRFFAERGWKVRLFVESSERLHPDVAPFTHRTDAATLWADPELRGFLCGADLVVAEFGVSFGLLHLLPALHPPTPAPPPQGGRENWPRILFEYHGVTPPELWEASERWRLDAALEDRGLAWCADRVIVKSRFTERELIEATGLPAEHVTRTPCFIRLEPDAQARLEPNPSLALRASIWCSDAKVLLHVGRLAKNKRVTLLVEAVARLPDVHAVIIGDTSDAYAAEAERCRLRAAELGVSDRVHLLGRVGDAELMNWYRTADALLIPSLHEGFCIPVIEAMACGLPVVAARAGALPETLGDAGLSFAVDDVDDLVRQVRRVLAPALLGREGPEVRGRGGRIAVVSSRFSNAFAGGAERSLARIATALKAAGHAVEVFTTCAVDEPGVDNALPAGTCSIDGISVHRFPTDPRDLDRHRRLVERAQDGNLSDTDVSMLLEESLNSSRLVAELVRRQDAFEAIIVGPYVHGLTWRVARQLGPRTLLLPCFHDEPLARLPVLQAVYREVGGVLYHTPEEQQFAEAELGINQPNSSVIGTWLDAEAGAGDASRGQAQCGSNYLVYCGRYCREKGLETLLEWRRRAQEHAPARKDFTLVVMGQNGAQLPEAPWLRDLGFVDELTKRDVLAGARALVLLSANESLSLVALEAWAVGTPVIASRGSAVLCGEIARSGGGVVIGSFAEFASVLDELEHAPECWRTLGSAGCAYIERHYRSRDQFVGRIERTLRPGPLPELLRQRGLERAAEFSYERWEESFSAVLEDMLGETPPPRAVELRIEPLTPRLQVGVGTERVLVPVRVTNTGSWPVSSGMLSRPFSDSTNRLGTDGPRKHGTPGAGPPPRPRPLSPKGRGGNAVMVPRLLPPGASQIVVVPVEVPDQVGEHVVEFVMDEGTRGCVIGKPLTLEVGEERCAPATPQATVLGDVRRTLAELHARQTLPDDYQDVTGGALAEVKRRLKKKLLHNFRTAYVDVLSRQQSAFNERVVTALCQLADAVALPPSPLAGEGRGGGGAQVAKLLRQTLRRQRQIERRLARLEQQLEALARTCP